MTSSHYVRNKPGLSCCCGHTSLRNGLVALLMASAIPRSKDEESIRGQDNVAYTVFSKQQKRWIVLLIAFAGMFSPLSSFIYYPAINSLASSLHTSVEAINLTITSYMVVSGITPSILGGTADQIGRRPIYIFSFLVYFIANIGLSLQHSFPALLVLRMIQSIGSSGAMISLPSSQNKYMSQ